MINKEKYLKLAEELQSENIKLVAVSKIQPVKAINELYTLGQKDFGENYVQEMIDKQSQLSKDIRWHFIGHLQSNKVKYIAPFVHLIQGVDSLKLLKEINKQGEKNNRVIKVLLQIHIAQEETKFGLDEIELEQVINAVINEPESFRNISVAGLMGMASFSENLGQVRKEFHYLKSLFNNYKSRHSDNCNMETLSMGMSSDYRVAIEEGSNMVRIGSLIFGNRT